MKKTSKRKKARIRKNPNFDRIMRGLEEATAYARGEANPMQYRVHAPAAVDVAVIRAKLGLTQEVFAEASARILLKVIEKRPDIVLEVLDAA
jgi:DNA-binding transcriptional regulator YiaG